jgi:hypothetical protein
VSSRFWLVCISFSLVAPSLVKAQEEAVVEQLAPVLAAEDARDWQPALFQRALVAPDSLVRRIAALAAGRIGDLRATPLLLRLLEQPDTTVSVAAAFALGLLRDTAAVQPLIARLTKLPALDTATADEAVTALAKTGGRRTADFFASILEWRSESADRGVGGSGCGDQGKRRPCPRARLCCDREGGTQNTFRAAGSLP